MTAQNGFHRVEVDPGALPRFTSWQWSDLLDELYVRATWLWEHDHEELANVMAELADALARQAWISSGIDIEEDVIDDPEA